jgi:SulP family sulfate permease
MFKLFFKKPQNFRDDVLSGLTVALALVPEAVAFAFVAGVDPFVGLYAAFFVGLITASLGGRPGMISGATGAMAVVMTAFVTLYGTAALFAALVLTGVFQILAGIAKVGRFIRLLPHPVMLGFVNGLAIVIGLAQLEQFKTGHELKFDVLTQSFTVSSQWFSVGDPIFLIMIGYVGFTMGLIHFLPKFTRSLPAPLVAILACTLLSQIPSLSTPTVVDVVQSQRLLTAQKKRATQLFLEEKDAFLVGELKEQGDRLAQQELPVADVSSIPQGLKAGLPQLVLPQIDWNDWDLLSAIVLLALTLASIGLIESLMTLSLIDEITETRGSANRECLAQGLANIVSGFFGAMGGCAMIGQSMININSGGRGRTSGISAALFLLGFIVLAPNLIEIIPVAALVGVMFMVVIATFEWSSFRLIGKIPASDMFVIVAVSALTVFFDLAMAVGVGVVLSALFYSWGCTERLAVEVEETGSINTKTYRLHGELFFGSASRFRELFSPREDPAVVSLDLSAAKVCDHSGIEAINSLAEKYRALGKTLQLANVNNDCSELLKKARKLINLTLVS